MPNHIAGVVSPDLGKPLEPTFRPEGLLHGPAFAALGIQHAPMDVSCLITQFIPPASSSRRVGRLCV